MLMVNISYLEEKLRHEIVMIISKFIGLQRFTNFDRPLVLKNSHRFQILLSGKFNCSLTQNFVI